MGVGVHATVSVLSVCGGSTLICVEGGGGGTQQYVVYVWWWWWATLIIVQGRRVGHTITVSLRHCRVGRLIDAGNIIPPSPPRTLGFGARQTVARLFHHTPGFRMLEHHVHNYTEELGAAKFCLAAAGWGWGGRMKVAVSHGCAPGACRRGAVSGCTQALSSSVSVWMYTGIFIMCEWMYTGRVRYWLLTLPLLRLPPPPHTFSHCAGWDPGGVGGAASYARLCHTCAHVPGGCLVICPCAWWVLSHALVPSWTQPS